MKMLQILVTRLPRGLPTPTREGSQITTGCGGWGGGDRGGSPPFIQPLFGGKTLYYTKHHHPLVQKEEKSMQAQSECVPAHRLQVILISKISHFRRITVWEDKSSWHFSTHIHCSLNPSLIYSISRCISFTITGLQSWSKMQQQFGRARGLEWENP
jgi:hypothetical protein